MVPYLMVILDEKGDIVDFASTLSEVEYTPKELIGRNWFDIFISPSDREKIQNVFQSIIQGDDRVFKTYKNDILCKNGRHRLIDFYNKLVTKDGKKYTFSVGIEHMDMDEKLLEKIGEEIFLNHPFFHN